MSTAARVAILLLCALNAFTSALGFYVGSPARASVFALASVGCFAAWCIVRNEP
jgi:hypothetical protein